MLSVKKRGPENSWLPDFKKGAESQCPFHDIFSDMISKMQL
jgi:hypothetical protein